MLLQKRLAWALFVLLLSTLRCWQPTEGFFLISFPILPPPPPSPDMIEPSAPPLYENEPTTPLPAPKNASLEE